MFWNVASARDEISAQMVWWFCAVVHFRGSINCKKCALLASMLLFSLMFLYTYYKPGMGKLVQWKRHLQKTKNTSEPQNQFVVSKQTGTPEHR